MRTLLFLVILTTSWSFGDAENRPNAAIDKRFKLTNFAKLKRVLRKTGPREEPYALPRPPLSNNEDHSGEQAVRTTASHERHRPDLPIHKMMPTNARKEAVKSGRRYGASHRKSLAVTRTTTTIPLTVARARNSLNQQNSTRAAWSPVPYVIASSSGESKQTPRGISRPASKNGVVEKSHSGFHTMSAGTTAFRRKILRMIVEQSLARKSNHSNSIKPDVVHVSGVYTDPNNRRIEPPTVSAEQRRKLLPGYPRPSHGSHSHENRLVVDVPHSRESSRGSEEAFEPVFQVQPATIIHENSNELVTTPRTTTLRRVEIKRPTTVIIHRKPPHAPPVFLRPTTTEPSTEAPVEEEEDEYTEFSPSSTDSNAIEEDEEEVTLSPYARSKLLRYAHRQRKRRVRQDDSIPSKFLQESLACRYCYVYWKRQDIQPRDIFTFCCRAKYRLV